MLENGQETVDLSRDHFGEYRRLILSELERLDTAQTEIRKKIESQRIDLEKKIEDSKKAALDEVKETNKAVAAVELKFSNQDLKLKVILGVWGFIVALLSGGITMAVVKYFSTK